MDKIFSTAIYIFVGYLCGMWLSDATMSTNLAQTDWANIWVYFWILLWPLGLLYYFLWYTLIAVVIILAIAFVLDILRTYKH